jgi:hypothetical protein
MNRMVLLLGLGLVLVNFLTTEAGRMLWTTVSTSPVTTAGPGGI